MSDTPHASRSAGLTVEQQEAVRRREVSVALSSGAGCGKTTVLTERFLSALDDGLPLSRLVAVTFTDKAATELRGRIRGECRQRLTGGVESSRWRSVLRGLEASRIGTIHSFCADLLRRFPVEAGLAPEFEVLDAQLAPTLQDEALSACMRRWLTEKNDDFEILAVECGLGGLRQALRSLMRSRRLSTLKRWASISEDDLIDLWRKKWEQTGRAAVQEVLLAREARECLKLLRGDVWPDHPKAVELRAHLLELLPGVLEPGTVLTEDQLDFISERAKVRGVSEKNWPSSELYERVKKSFEKLRKAITEVTKATTWDEQETRRAAELGLRFVRLGLEAMEDYRQMKAERELVDFDDLLERALDLVCLGPDETRNELVAEIDLLMVDEYQDTDPVQASILETLAGEEKTAGRFFLVGDSKQSIYRFRGAVPKLFDTFRQTLPQEGRLALSVNFRSQPALIEFVNELFRETALYKDADAPLQPGLNGPAPDQGPPRPTPPAVEFLWQVEDVGQEAPQGEVEVGEDENSRRRREAEARRIAGLLAHRLRGGWPIWDEGKKCWRDARPGDVALLFRSMTDVIEYEQALTSAGLDFLTVAGKAFFGQQEVVDLINLLATLEDPLDPLALAATLRSPFFGLSDEGIYWLGTPTPEKSQRELQENLERLEEVEALSRIDRRRAIRAREMLRNWRARKDREPVGRLLSDILDETGYEAALMAEPFGARRRANVRKLIGLARQYDRAGFALADVASRLKNDFRRMTEEELAATTTESEKAVRLMSIHKAKGLEFPIVVLPDLGKKTPTDNDRLSIHPELGPVVKLDPEDPSNSNSDRPESLGKKLSSILERWEERQEALRLFYVATTRARNHLILSAALDPGEAANSKEPALELLSSRFHLETGKPRNDTPLSVGLAHTAEELARPAQESGDVGILDAKLASVLRCLRPVAERRAPSPPAPDWPRWIDLDAVPGRSDHQIRVDQLALALLADPRTFKADPKELVSIAVELGKTWAPAIPRRIAVEAVSLLERRPTRGMVERLRRIKKGRWRVPWGLAFSPAGRPLLSSRGSLDWVGKGPDGILFAVVFVREGVPVAWERLRLLMGVRALGDTAAYEGLVGRLIDPEDPIPGAFEEDLGDDVLSSAIEEGLASVSRMDCLT